MNGSDYIQGERFQALADSGHIFYCHTHEAEEFFRSPPLGRFVLITHNSDSSVDSMSGVPKNLVKWFSQNVNFKDTRLTSIPLGIENSEWFKSTKKREKMTTKLKEQKKPRNLLYVNHNEKTNPRERKGLYGMFQDKKWATAVKGRNPKNFEAYLDNIYNHKFVLCPEGNGMDTHRTWECLYMNTIPIEKRNLNNRFYTDLPICFVDDWGEISRMFLEKEYERITSTKWNTNKLKMGYWKSKILCQMLVLKY